MQAAPGFAAAGHQPRRAAGGPASRRTLCSTLRVLQRGPPQAVDVDALRQHVRSGVPVRRLAPQAAQLAFRLDAASAGAGGQIRRHCSTAFRWRWSWLRHARSLTVQTIAERCAIVSGRWSVMATASVLHASASLRVDRLVVRPASIIPGAHAVRAVVGGVRRAPHGGRRPKVWARAATSTHYGRAGPAVTPHGGEVAGGAGPGAPRPLPHAGNRARLCQRMPVRQGDEAATQRRHVQQVAALAVSRPGCTWAAPEQEAGCSVDAERDNLLAVLDWCGRDADAAPPPGRCCSGCAPAGSSAAWWAQPPLTVRALAGRAQGSIGPRSRVLVDAGQLNLVGRQTEALDYLQDNRRIAETGRPPVAGGSAAAAGPGAGQPAARRRFTAGLQSRPPHWPTRWATSASWRWP